MCFEKNDEWSVSFDLDHRQTVTPAETFLSTQLN